MTATFGYHVSDFQDRLQTALGDGYHIERELDGAGMSRVFVARERALQRTVVIKVLPPDLAAGVNVDRFRREIQLAAQLQHPHIVPLLAAGEEDGLLWFSMPFIEGESLRQALLNRGQLSPRDVVRILHDVVDALAYAHARGIVHRDIKPGNILTQGMHALVTDFGVAKALSEAIPLPLHGGTTSGMAIGTPAYMAPEQLAADPDADPRVDIYAVGLLAYEVLTGKSPFSGAPHTLSVEIPAELSTIIMRCLEKQASKRPDTAAALLSELEALPPMSGTTPARRMSSAGRRTRNIIAGAAVLAAAAWALTTRLPMGAAKMTGADSLDARDAGPGGARQRAAIGRTPSIKSGDSIRIVSETIPVFREVGDGTPVTAVPLVMTRAESLAIAEAILKRQQAQKIEHSTSAAGATNAADPKAAAAPSAATSGSGVRVMMHTTDGAAGEVTREQLIAEVTRIFTDSMAQALTAYKAALAAAPRSAVRFTGPPPGGDPGMPPNVVIPPMPNVNVSVGTDIGRGSAMARSFTLMAAPSSDGRLRVLVMPFQNATGKRDYLSAAREMTTAIRASIPADKFDVVADTIADRAMRMSPDRFQMGWQLRSDYMLTGMITTRQDSVVYHLQWVDIKSGRNTRYFEVSAPSSDAKKAIDPSKLQVASWLDSASVFAAQRQRGRPGDRRY